jgi:hypothetical protein
VDLVDNYGRTALAVAIGKAHHECAEVLLHAGASLGKVKGVIPEWMNKIIAKRDSFNAAFTVLYGILRRRIVVPLSDHQAGERIPRDMVRVISDMLLDTRFDVVWVPK